jgi:hypothetical protein
MFSLPRSNQPKSATMTSGEIFRRRKDRDRPKKRVTWADQDFSSLEDPVEQPEPRGFNFEQGLQLAKTESKSFFDKYGITSVKEKFSNLKSKVTLGVKIGLAVTVLAVVVGTVYFYKGKSADDEDDDEEEEERPKKKKAKSKAKSKKQKQMLVEPEESGMETAARMQEQAFKDYSDRLWQLKNKGIDLMAHINKLKETQGKVSSLYNSLNGSTELDPGMSDSTVSLGSEGFGTAFMLPEERQEQNKMSGYQLQQVSNELTKSQQELNYLNQQYNTVMTEFTKAFGQQERIRMEQALKNS